jgi:hypothetical protein
MGVAIGPFNEIKGYVCKMFLTTTCIKIMQKYLKKIAKWRCGDVFSTVVVFQN